MKKLHACMTCMWEFWPLKPIKYYISEIFPYFTPKWTLSSTNRKTYTQSTKIDQSNMQLLFFIEAFVLGNPVVFREFFKFKLLHAGIFCLISCLVDPPPPPLIQLHTAPSGFYLNLDPILEIFLAINFCLTHLESFVKKMNTFIAKWLNKTDMLFTFYSEE